MFQGQSGAADGASRRQLDERSRLARTSLARIGRLLALVREVRRRGRWTRPGRAEPRAPRLAASLLPILPILGLLGLAPAAPTASATPVPAGSGTPITGDYAGAGASLHYIGYVPSSWGPGKSLPLVVALHGCTESADQFRQLTGFDQLAEQRGFIVVYPEQTQAANYLLCWNWFRSTDQARGSGEPALIAGLTNSVAQRYGVDRSRIYVTGLSAGGAMSAVMGATFPDLYAAVGIGSGCQYGGGVGCLSGNATDPTVTGQLAHAAMDVRARTLPAVVFQGDADTTVPAANAAQLVRQWQVSADWADDGAVNGSVPAAPSAVVQGQVPGGRSYTV
ncbi:MAG: hypothetical protein QOK40_1407, partial [Miltoncostaeaceae bacterium]|nr:hypothetical protein [Miltoncostaeaceae bacterium]